MKYCSEETFRNMLVNGQGNEGYLLPDGDPFFLILTSQNETYVAGNTTGSGIQSIRMGQGDLFSQFLHPECLVIFTNPGSKGKRKRIGIRFRTESEDGHDGKNQAYVIIGGKSGEEEPLVSAYFAFATSYEGNKVVTFYVKEAREEKWIYDTTEIYSSKNKKSLMNQFYLARDWLRIPQKQMDFLLSGFCVSDGEGYDFRNLNQASEAVGKRM